MFVSSKLKALAIALFSLALVACGPRFSPRGPGDDPAFSPTDQGAVASSTERDTEPLSAAPGQPDTPPLAQQILVGEMCPRAAGGRPAVLPLFLRTVHWSSDSEEVSLPIERRSARSFSVMGWDGGRAGVFSVAGAADVGIERKAAVGAYAGVSPCSPSPGNRGESHGQPGQLDSACMESQSDCGVALALVEPMGASARPYEEDPEPLSLPVAGACIAGDKLLVDIDDDGIREAYPAAGFLDPVRAPAEEVLAVPTDGATCAPTFARRSVIPGQNPKHFRGLDLIAVVDLDSDGRKELIVVYHYEKRRTWAVYTAASTVARLDLASEAVPWSQR